jgi:hypothetical protein
MVATPPDNGLRAGENDPDVIRVAEPHAMAQDLTETVGFGPVLPARRARRPCIEWLAALALALSTTIAAGAVMGVGAGRILPAALDPAAADDARAAGHGADRNTKKAPVAISVKPTA